MRTRPPQLQPGDRIAAVSPSWGGPGAFPERYAVGKRQFAAEFGLEVVEMPHTLADPEWLDGNPAARAADLMAAFSDPSIAGIVATIGGDDAIRLLPYLDLAVIRANPKVFVGYSDTTILHLACWHAGITSFYGPSLMTGFAENGGIDPYAAAAFKRAVFLAEPPGLLRPNAGGWTVERLPWEDPASQERRRRHQPPMSWRWLQGAGRHQGHLLGGCLEVLSWLHGTPFWPPLHEWQHAILFLETSEEAPPPELVTRFVRTLAAQGVLERLSGVLLGRPGGDQLDPSAFDAYDAALLAAIRDEAGLHAMPIITRLDFGHTDPVLTLPYGVQALLDCDQQTLTILEAAVTARSPR